MENFELEHLQQVGVTLKEYSTIKSEAPGYAERQVEEHGLTMVEYAAIVLRLGRHPNKLELDLFGTMWCEHSGYAHSKPLLEMFDDLNAALDHREGE